MDIRRLEEFIAVLDTGSLSKAAEKLGVAQPALSQSLARLERELGVKLFQRSRRGAEPTPAARQIAEEVRRGVFRIVNAIDAAQAIAAGRAGVLRVEMSNAEQAQALSRGEIDVALVHTPVALSGVMHEKVLMRERLVAAVPQDLLPGGQDRVSMADIARAGLVMFPHAQLPTFYEAVMDAFRKEGLDAEIVQEANRTLTVLACVAGGCGIALLPSWIRSLDFAGVRYCEVADGARLPSFDVSAIWPKHAVAGLADDFVRACGAGQ